MVFFNYSTMQMAAKVVYYGPGLCGKTTNLQYVYRHTTSDSRGEMVSLETETDRTLFFDLLPLEVGQIGGFKTRIQLYTVPGQVFYNTTRKLVLKGVDGVVFVADSQRPMLGANVESLNNLRDNLAELGLSLDALPIALQYNKRDLVDVCTVEEMNAALNGRGWPHFEASALNGQGVFETLKGISRLTLMSLKNRLARPAEPAPSFTPVPLAAPRPPATTAVVAPAAPAAKAATAPSLRTAEIPIAPAPPRSSGPPSGARPALGPRTSDPFLQLETLRQQARGAMPLGNGQREISRNLQVSLKREDWARVRRLALTLQVEDADRGVVEAIRDLTLDLDNPADAERVLLRLSIALSARD
jgi:hypothetical protein